MTPVSEEVLCTSLVVCSANTRLALKLAAMRFLRYCASCRASIATEDSSVVWLAAGSGLSAGIGVGPSIGPVETLDEVPLLVAESASLLAKPLSPLVAIGVLPRTEVRVASNLL